MASALDAHFCTPDEAMAQIRDGQTVATVAMTLVSASESNQIGRASCRERV